MTDREEFEKWFDENNLNTTNHTKELMQKAWQARGELDAVRIKELEKEVNYLKSGVAEVLEARITELIAKNKELESKSKDLEAELEKDLIYALCSGHKLIYGLKSEIRLLRKLNEEMYEALYCIDEDLVNPVHYTLVKEALANYRKQND